MKIYGEKRETEGLLSAMDTFGLNKGLILTEDVEEEIMVGNKKIAPVPVRKWLLVG
jgi:predicted AAA+ superfamily ATPase